MIFKTLISLTFSILIIANVEAKNCNEIRAGLDIGSGSTKVLVVKVDYCLNKIIETLHSQSLSVQYNEAFEKDNNGLLNNEIQQEGIRQLEILVKKAKELKAKKIKGVATSVFRMAKNGKDVIDTFSKKLKIPIRILSQEEEGHLGYLSALSQIDDKKRSILVWDIGGGSMQMFTYDVDKKPVYFLGQLASVTFKNMIVEIIQGKNINNASSPNPISQYKDQSIALARTYARLHVPAYIKKSASQIEVIGIGGVHNLSIKNQMQLKDMSYSLEQLSSFAKSQVEKSDNDLIGDYKATDVSNLLLVQGFMEALGINEVKILNANLLQGLLLE